eukprot:1443054-Pleurochrysis_carterae.AAC.1
MRKNRIEASTRFTRSACAKSEHAHRGSAHKLLAHAAHRNLHSCAHCCSSRQARIAVHVSDRLVVRPGARAFLRTGRLAFSFMP